VIDETLLAPRRVLRSEPTDDGLGHSVELECGHTIWIAVEPPSQIHCGACLQALVNQVRELQGRQRIE
jgi:hypothetical protein